jgi:hypothetical protein
MIRHVIPISLLFMHGLGTLVNGTQESTRKITSSHHLRLATHIYRQQNELDDLLSLLQNPRVGLDSSVGMGDGEFIRCEIDLLKEKGLYDQLFDLCHLKLKTLVAAKQSAKDPALIQSLSGTDDWFIWNALLDSCWNPSKSE